MIVKLDSTWPGYLRLLDLDSLSDPSMYFLLAHWATQINTTKYTMYNHTSLCNMSASHSQKISRTVLSACSPSTCLLDSAPRRCVDGLPWEHGIGQRIWDSVNSYTT